MPKISAPSVAEHVARQEQRVFDTAIELFMQHGYASVSFGEIAEAVGLARNSLYRYFPSKADILTRWFHRELERRLERSAQILDRDQPAMELIAAWVDDQLDYAARPEHALMASMGQYEPGPANEIRSEIFGVHSRLLAPLLPILARAGVADDAVSATGALIGGLILSAARFEADQGAPNPEIRGRLRRAVRALLSP